MFRILSKKKLDDIRGKLSEIEGKITGYKEKLEEASRLLEEANHKNNDLSERISELEGELESARTEEVVSDTSFVKMHVAEDIQSVTPIVKYNPEIFEKLVELNYLSDKEAGSEHAIQLALMNISFEALQQIIESFTEEPDNE